jgi:hypothetical protein
MQAGEGRPPPDGYDLLFLECIARLDQPLAGVLNDVGLIGWLVYSAISNLKRILSPNSLCHSRLALPSLTKGMLGKLFFILFFSLSIQGNNCIGPDDKGGLGHAGFLAFLDDPGTWAARLLVRDQLAIDVQAAALFQAKFFDDIRQDAPALDGEPGGVVIEGGVNCKAEADDLLGSLAFADGFGGKL